MTSPEQGGNFGESMTVDEGVSMSMQSLPLAIRLAEDLGNAKIPPMLDALLLACKLHSASLDEYQPGQTTVGSTVEELDCAGAASPLGGDYRLALRRFGAAWTETADRTEDGAVIR